MVDEGSSRSIYAATTDFDYIPLGDPRAIGVAVVRSSYDLERDPIKTVTRLYMFFDSLRQAFCDQNREVYEIRRSRIRRAETTNIAEDKLKI